MTMRYCLLTGLALLVSAQLHAKNPEPWWFDIEVIVFKRHLQTPTAEKFEQAGDLARTYTYDLTYDELMPNITGLIRALPLCSDAEPSMLDQVYSNTPELTEPTTAVDNTQQLPEIELTKRFDCLSEQDVERVNNTFFFVDNRLPDLVYIPKRIDGKNKISPQHPHILPISEQQLVDFANDIERIRGHQILHHTVWRQEVVFGKDVAPGFRLVAGENFMASYLASQANNKISDGAQQVQNAAQSRKTPEAEIDFFSQLYEALLDEQPADIDSILMANEKTPEAHAQDPHAEWELDGEFKVFLKYINRVPYLHIDSELVFQRLNLNENEVQTLDLQRIPFKQLRRVISKQIHYFDHPLFGMVVQIRRHQRPSIIDTEDTSDVALTKTID